MHRPRRNDASGRVRNRGARKHVDHVVEMRQDRGNRTEQRASVRVTPQADQQDVPRLVRVERGLRVPLERDRRRRGELPGLGGSSRHDVLHEPAAVLLDVADRLAEAPGNGEERELAVEALPRVRAGFGRRAPECGRWARGAASARRPARAHPRSRPARRGQVRPASGLRARRRARRPRRAVPAAPSTGPVGHQRRG